jgi:hypothetical protein
LAARGKFGDLFRNNVSKQWLRQASRQIDAAGNRLVTWYFEELGSLEFARRLFQTDDKLKKIRLEHGFWREGTTWKRIV